MVNFVAFVVCERLRRSWLWKKSLENWFGTIQAKIRNRLQFYKWNPFKTESDQKKSSLKNWYTVFCAKIGQNGPIFWRLFVIFWRLFVIFIFFGANLQLFYNFFIKSKIITKKNKISSQILFFFWPKLPLLWSPKKVQKQRKWISRFLGPDGNMKKSLKCNDIPRENWVKSSLSKYAYYRRLCSITGWIWHFCEKP